MRVRVRVGGEGEGEGQSRCKGVVMRACGSAAME